MFSKACIDYDINPKLDICASKTNHVTPAYLTKKDDCLTYDIKTDFFMNAPYSEQKKMMGFAFGQYLKNNVNALILAYSKTDTKWWHDFVEGIAEVHFIKGRIKFLDENGILARWCKECKTKYSEEIDFCPDCSLFEPVKLTINLRPISFLLDYLQE